ncbi:WD40-repeat-containing domain protein [Syncephalis pseudoplumigaleata]|uniref:WD40-repeat-containing domain protein n=1 Tax=Syncephalis pseudoplumigaleata TaxID=1712513 RepID=A0A4P9Z191_9FUNG|nr:WD40-repeat-containing domain protein [Syncephalis pseudoplumigaleata]|eukprot:RKP26065.1 WD40-repeat-containing domain protein [Syncephalis pseudoplumigaleata]
MPIHEHGDEEFVEADDVEQIIDVATGDVPLPDEEDEEGADAPPVDADMDDDTQMEEFKDDSVQGFFAHQEPVYCVAAHPTDPTLFATGGGDDKAYLWRADTGETVTTLERHTDSVTSIAFSHDGLYLATGGMDGKVNVWQVGDAAHIATLDGPDEVEWIDWHPKGHILLAGARDTTLWMWQLPSGRCMHVFAGHSGAVTCGQFTPDGKWVVSGAEDGTLILWDPKTAAAVTRISGSEDARFHSGMVTALAVNADSTVVATTSDDQTVKLVHLHTGQILGSLENNSEAIESVAFNDNMPLVAAGSLDGTVNLWDITTYRLRHTLQHDDAVIRVRWVPGTTWLVTCSADGSVRLWDGLTGQLLKQWLGHQETILDFAVSCDKRTLVSGGDDGVALVFRYN